MRRALGVVTRGGAAAARSVGPAGRAVLALLVASYAAVRWAGLAEFVVVGVLCVVLLVLALPFVLLPTRVRARIVLRPTHTVAGETGVARLHVRNRSPLPLLHPAVRLPIGRDEVWRRLPTLRPGVETVHELAVPTTRRGVIGVGPVRARRTDPLGLLRREATWGRAAELYVRPRMITLDALGTGFLRDQDGAPLDEISMDDLAFHALREYVRGDDLRHVHWRSSARAGQLLVRQYHQTRRNHVTVLLDDAGSAYDGEEDFELAVSVAASLALRASLDQCELTFVCGPEVVSGRDASEVLDACCRVALDADGSLAAAAHRAVRLAPDTSLLLVTGERTSRDAVGGARLSWPGEVRTLLFRAGASAESQVRDEAGVRAVRVGRLGDLPRLLGGLTAVTR